MAINPKTEKALAEDYGFALSFFKSDPELWKVFKSAIGPPSWGDAKIQAAIKNTKWFKTHGENYRQNLAQSKLDPATFNQNVNQQIASIGDQAGQMGAHLSAAQMKKLATNATLFGWNSSQIQNMLASYVQVSGATGSASDDLSALQQAAWRNGVKYNSNTYQNMVRQIALGNHTLSDYQQSMRNLAAGLAPGLSDQLKGGQDLYDLASPYMQSMAQTLEMNPTDIDLFDPTIRKALAYSPVSPAGKPAPGGTTTQPLYEFEQTLRNDPRWTKTDNAQNSFLSAAHGVLQSFGVAT